MPLPQQVGVARVGLPHPLSDRYWGSFCICALICLALQLYTRNRDSARKAETETVVVANNDDEAKGEVFATFQRNYLVVYLLAVFADWLALTTVWRIAGAARGAQK